MVLCARLEMNLRSRYETLLENDETIAPIPERYRGIKNYHDKLMCKGFRYADDTTTHEVIIEAIEKVIVFRNDVMHGDRHTLTPDRMLRIIDGIEKLRTFVEISGTITLGGIQLSGNLTVIPA